MYMIPLNSLFALLLCVMMFQTHISAFFRHTLFEERGMGLFTTEIVDGIKKVSAYIKQSGSFPAI